MDHQVQVGFMQRSWYKRFHRFICATYFSRVKVVHPERLPGSGPVLYLGLHRNGAVDGFVYNAVLRNPLFMLSGRLTKNWFARLFFGGITVTRTRDEGDRSQNAAAMSQCLEHLKSGGELFIFPEGTSSLGPRHLPFKSGAAWLLLDYLQTQGPPIQVVPVGIHYDSPWAFRSRVEVVIGAPLSTQLPPDATRLEAVKILKRRVQDALALVGLNLPSEDSQETIQRLACAATLRTSRSYFEFLKQLEERVPAKVAREWAQIEPRLASRSALLQYQGFPRFPSRSVLWDTGALLLALPLTLSALTLNLPPLIAGWLAGVKFPDGPNVVSLWKILVGIPTFILWIAATTASTLLLGKPAWLLVYALVTWSGLALYDRTRKLCVAVWNGLTHSDLAPALAGLHRALLDSLPHERA